VYREASVKIPHRDGNKVIGLDCNGEQGSNAGRENARSGEHPRAIRG
jgi:hypothetical protein